MPLQAARLWVLVAAAMVACSAPGAPEDAPDPASGPTCTRPAEDVVCGGLEGSSTLESLRGCTRVTGSITWSVDADLSPLAELVEVEGALTLFGSAEQDLDALSNLQVVGGGLTVSGFGDMSGLQCVRSVQTLWLFDNAGAQIEALVSLDGETVEGLELHSADIADIDSLGPLPGLRHLAAYGGSLQRLTWPGATSALDTLVLQALPEFTQLSGFDAVTSIETLTLSGVQLADLTSLSSLEQVGALTLHGVDSYVGLEGVAELAELSLGDTEAEDLTGLDGLRVVTGSVDIDGGERSVRSLVGLGGLTDIGGDLWVLDNERLEEAPLDSLRSVGGSVLVSDNPVLRSIGLGHLGDPYIVRIEDNGWLESLELDATSLVELHVSGNGALAELDTLPSLEDAGSVYIQENRSLARVGGFGILQAADLIVESNRSLAVVDGFVARADGDSGGPNITFTGNDALTQVSLASLTTAGSVIFTDNGPYTLGGLEALRSADTLRIVDQDALVDLSGLDGVQQVDILQIADNDALCQSTVDAWVAARNVGEAATSGNDDGC